MGNIVKTAFMLIILLIIAPKVQSQPAIPRTYDELVEFFFSWRQFHHPNMRDGVPDYTKEAMDKQYHDLAAWKRNLNEVDTAGWSVSHRIDWMLIWAEMNGLYFAHTVKKPWERDPAFYVWFYQYQTDVPEREGPNIHGAIELPNYTWPLSAEDAAEIGNRLDKAAQVFKQARKNLVGNARDLWITGTRTIRGQSATLLGFAEMVAELHPDLAAAAREVSVSSDALAEWLSAQSSSKTGLSGVGKDNYTWNLKNVHLLPYSWEDELILMQRELARAHTALRLEEHRNRDQPKLSKIDNKEDYDRLFNEAIDEYLQFLEEEDVLPIKDYMEPALHARINEFTPSDELRGFFSEVHYRDPIIMRTHDYHWMDLAMMRDEPNESRIRRTPLLYNIFDGRAEGMATGMEEMMMHAGLLDDKPRARELIWILLAQRAARGLGGLYQHGLEMTFDQATEFASKWTPWGLLPAEGSTIQFEEQFYLQQPGYGTSYVIGKIEIEKLIAEYARQRDGNFDLSTFMDEFNKTGIIPVSMIHWELTGEMYLDLK